MFQTLLKDEIKQHFFISHSGSRFTRHNHFHFMQTLIYCLQMHLPAPFFLTLLTLKNIVKEQVFSRENLGITSD